ncbi:MerR family transcriptional regulator [Virgibacillus halodenitrificans]|uniref:Transcriptional regulator n=1 Tax=Virgibacillus halodenitrificans TaxID=1482 RepID=A0AAC9IX42_VIRHA|nr:MerR family transcriptional regulator [Virgibacillus halodenitrificans]APC47706.1 transcriptional regulator [Virgibacillus halodenitrificans]MBD1222056.1 MerR family transcriptional regulator [Virgibacillus halodenitrificans]MCG1028814.1 MerR family transcriptional regulator [Virgibacillus halodenitrificans]MCJ0930565.1 MerR family transcriptional regulator [Virgibacillus halodenitrificans]MEC2158859.1 MerR family transcriptional regulator [Virgibacillus halodenitrificans]
MHRWTTGELSKQRNISVRTLRYYDQINLLTPSFKDTHGKRYYSEDDLFKLEKIMILKSLSLPLEDIRGMLDKLSYKQILISHYNYLQEQLSEIQTSISNTTTLINLMDLEESLSWERVSELVQNSQKNHKKWLNYFQEHEQVILENTLPNLSNNDKTTHQYISLLRRIEWCIKHNIKPESEEGFQIASELIEVSNTSFSENTELADKFWEVRKLPAEETGLFPIEEDVLEFVERCIAYVSN